MTEQLVAEIATRLCGPHSRERLSRSKRLINTKDLVLTFDTASPSMDSLGAINLILDLARGRI